MSNIEGEEAHYLPDPELQFKIDYIEGDGYYETIKDEIIEAMQGIGEIREMAEMLGDDPDREVIQSIYGNGGWNRYFVMSNGTVEFSKMHGSAEDVKKAQEVGFELF